MEYSQIEPEVSGVLGPRTVLDTGVFPPAIRHLHFEFEGWLGDCLLESFPAYVLTLACSQRCLGLGLSGCSFHELDVSIGPSFHEAYSGPPLPSFVRAQFTGRAGEADFGLDAAHHLVVSRRALDLLHACGLKEAVVTPWRPAAP